MRRPKGPLGWIVMGVAVVALVFVVRAVLHRSRQHEPPPNAFYEVKRGDLLISVTEEGSLRAVNETVVRSGLDGLNRIISLVPEGSFIKKGDLLVELDSSTLRNTLHEQELVYQDKLFFLLQAKENSRIQQSLAESQIKDAELRGENAQSDLEKFRDGDGPLLIRTAEARIRVLEEQVRIAGERHVRTEVLFQNGNATKSEVEADSLTLKREQLGLKQYQEDLRLIQKFDHPNKLRLLESNLQQAKDELDRLKQRSANEAAQMESDLTTSQKALNVMEEALKQQKRRLENSKIFAPQDGIVVYAASSPFQDRGDSGRDEGRSRMREGVAARLAEMGGFQVGGGGGGRRGRGRGGFGEQNNFSGGGGSGGNRGGSLGSSSGASSPLGASSQSSASGSASQASQAGSGVSGSAQAAGGQTSSGGSSQRSSSGGGGTGGSSGNSASSGAGGQRSSSGLPSFTTFSPLRQSSFAPSSSAAGQSSGAGSSGGQGSGGLGSSGQNSSGNLSGGGNSSGAGGQSLNLGAGSQGASRFSSRSSDFDRGSFDFSSGSGIVEEGSMVRQRQELIRLPDISQMLAEVKIQEGRVRQIRPGMLAYVRVETLPGRRFKGSVRRVGLLPDTQSSWMNPDSKVYATDVLIDDELPVLKPGVSARAEIIITNLVNVLSVPIQSVTTFNGDYVCFAKRGRKVTPVPVTTGWFNDQLIEIRSGLKEGDRVLLAPISDEDIFGIDISPSSTNEVEIE